MGANTTAQGHDVEEPKCFIIGPISDATTARRRYEKYKAEYFLEKIFAPACSDAGFKAHRIDRDEGNEFISNAMIRGLAQDSMAIALLDDQGTAFEPDATLVFNPNVVYEIGLRHAWCLPVVIVSSVDAKLLPFDLRDCPVVSFERIPDGWDSASGDSPWGAGGSDSDDGLRDRLAARLRALSGTSRYTNRFREGLQLRSLTSQIQLLLQTKGRSLKALRKSMRRFKKRVSQDYEIPNKNWGAFPALAELLDDTLSEFWSEISTCQWIAEDQLDRAPGNQLLVGVCARMNTIADSLGELVKAFRTPDREMGYDAVLAGLYTKIESVIDGISACIDHGNHLLGQL